MFNGEKLSAFMKREGMTNVALAKKLGVSEGAVRHIIVGIKQPSLYMACESAQMMGCTVDDLVTVNNPAE